MALCCTDCGLSVIDTSDDVVPSNSFGDETSGSSRVIADVDSATAAKIFSDLKRKSLNEYRDLMELMLSSLVL